MVHGILRHRVCGGKVGHPGTGLECPSIYGTRDTQTQGLCGASRTSRDSPGVSEYLWYTGYSDTGFVWGKLGQSWSVQVTMVHVHGILRHRYCQYLLSNSDIHEQLRTIHGSTGHGCC